MSDVMVSPPLDGLVTVRTRWVRLSPLPTRPRHGLQDRFRAQSIFRLFPQRTFRRASEMPSSFGVVLEGTLRTVTHTCDETLSNRQAHHTSTCCSFVHPARCLLINLTPEQRTSYWISLASLATSRRVKSPRPYKFALISLKVPRHPATMGTMDTLHLGCWVARSAASSWYLSDF